MCRLEALSKIEKNVFSCFDADFRPTSNRKTFCIRPKKLVSFSVVARITFWLRIYEWLSTVLGYAQRVGALFLLPHREALKWVAGLRLALGLVGWLLLCAAPVSAGKQVVVQLDAQSYAALEDSMGLHLDVRVERADELEPAMLLYTGKLGQGSFSYKKLGISKKSSTRALIPFPALAPLFKRQVIAKLWPEDRYENGHWYHRVKYNGHETLWSLSNWFTGYGRNFRGILKASGRTKESISRGDLLKIPDSLLLSWFKPAEAVDIPRPEDPQYSWQTEVVEEEVVESEPVEPLVTEVDEQPPLVDPEEEQEEAAPRGLPDPDELGEAAGKSWAEVAELRKALTYDENAAGKYAIYRLKPGEAIYSSVVVRFCGLVRAADVLEVAAELISLNGIRDVTDMAVGTPIRIPYNYLEPEFKDEQDPEFRAYIQNLREVSEVAEALPSRVGNLEDVYLILDAGHGGRDPGAHFHGHVWEDDYVYDIICRIKERIERETSAVVYTTVLDPSVEYKVQDVGRFTMDQDEVLLTNPRYALNDRYVTTIGVNLRWVLTNHIYHKLMERKVNPENVIFASFHADSLHQSLRGSMVYIPDARVYPSRVSAAGTYKRFREYEGNNFSFSKKEMRKAQARSLSFAQHFIEMSRAAGLEVHDQKPIRSVIYRDPRRPFVPAVIRYNRVPTRMLIEVCNLNNRHDRAEMRKHEYRQAVADAFVETVYRTYGIGDRKAVLEARKDRARGE